MHLFILYNHLFVYPSICPYTSLSTLLSLYLSVCLSSSWSIYRFPYLPSCLSYSINKKSCLSVSFYLSAPLICFFYPSNNLPIPSVSLLFHPSIYPSFYLTLFLVLLPYTSITLSISVYPSISLCVCLFTTYLQTCLSYSINKIVACTSVYPFPHHSIHQQREKNR